MFELEYLTNSLQIKDFRVWLTATQLKEHGEAVFLINFRPFRFLCSHGMEKKITFWKTLPFRTFALGPWSSAPKRSINSGSQGFTGSTSNCALLFFYTHLPFTLTGNIFLCNLPWQGENISIKQRLPWQTSLVWDNLPDCCVPPGAALPLFNLVLCVLHSLSLFGPLCNSHDITWISIFSVAINRISWHCLSCLTPTLTPLLDGCTLGDTFSRDECTPLDTFRCLNYTFQSFPLIFLPFYSLHVHRCAVPIPTSGRMEVPSDGQQQHHRWKDTFWICKQTCVGADVCNPPTGFNLVRRFALLKSTEVKKIRNPRGAVILRLGKTALLRPTEWVYRRCRFACSLSPSRLNARVQL